MIVLGEDAILTLAAELLKLGNLLFGLLAFSAHLGDGGLHGILAAHEGVDVLFLDGETSLDTLLASPVLAMGLALDENLLLVHASVPSQTQSLSTLRLFQTTHVQLKIFIVIVDGRDGTVGRVKLLVGVEDENGKVLEDVELELGDVVGVNPVLCGVADKGLLAATGGGVTTVGLAPGPDLVVEAGQLDDQGIVVLLVKWLGVESDHENGPEDPMGEFLYRIPTPHIEHKSSFRRRLQSKTGEREQWDQETEKIQMGVWLVILSDSI